ncbi:MAG: hypothetical protein ACLFSQ_03695 [Candidatus Zixiibacteriota bacterium]
MEPGIIILLTLLTVVLTAVSVFFIILLVRLIKLTKNAEETLSIVNNRLPESLDNLARLIDHAESSLDKLDITLRRIQEPIDDFSKISKAGHNVVSGLTSGISDGNPKQVLDSIGNNFSRVLTAALSGGVIALLRKYVFGKFGKKNKGKAQDVSA